MSGVVERVARQRTEKPRWAIAVAAATLILILAGLAFQRAGAIAPSNEHFEERWSRTDQPVRDGVAIRTWMWGPEAFTEELLEEYAQSPDGQRQVQYFDKARMEINQPDADPDSLWYVTNGLLVVELVSGNMQVGDATFVEREPAEVPVAGDPDDENGVTYATFGPLLDAEPADEGEIYQTRLSRDGTLTVDAALAGYEVTASYLDDVTNHRIAAPFWDFMNSSGTIYVDGAFVEGPLFQNPFYATGRPITEAYWVRSKVNDVEQDVLVQCFERRCLTYTPANDPNWQVEAGNVGQHYYRWRYEMAGPTPTPTEPAPTPSPTPEPAGNVTVTAAVDCDADGDSDGLAQPVGEPGPCGPLTGGEVETLSDGMAGPVNEVQVITPNNAVGGTFTLVFNHPTAGNIIVAAIPYNVTSGQLSGILGPAFGAEEVGLDAPIVTGGPLNENAIELTFESEGLGATDVPETLIFTNFTQPTDEEFVDSDIETVVDGGSGVNEVQQLTPNGATGGQFTFAINHPTQGLLSTTMPFDVTAEEARTMIFQTFNARGVGVDAPDVTGGPADELPLTFTFENGALAGVDIEQSIVNNTLLTTTVTEARVEVLSDGDVVETWQVLETGRASGDLDIGSVYEFRYTYSEDTGQADVVTSDPVQILGEENELTLTAILEYGQTVPE